MSSFTAIALMVIDAVTGIPAAVYAVLSFVGLAVASGVAPVV